MFLNYIRLFRAISLSCRFANGSFCGNIPVGQENVRVNVPITNRVGVLRNKAVVATPDPIVHPPEAVVEQYSYSNAYRDVHEDKRRYLQSEMDSFDIPSHSSNAPYIEHDFEVRRNYMQHSSLSIDTHGSYERYRPPSNASQDRYHQPSQPYSPLSYISHARQQPLSAGNGGFGGGGGGGGSDYTDESKRLKSFFTWPRDIEQQPMALVKAGFFYTGKKDIVQCCMCHLIIGGWRRGERPMQEHQIKRSTCPFLLNLLSPQPFNGYQQPYGRVTNYQTQPHLPNGYMGGRNHGPIDMSPFYRQPAVKNLQIINNSIPVYASDVPRQRHPQTSFGHQHHQPHFQQHAVRPLPQNTYHVDYGREQEIFNHHNGGGVGSGYNVSFDTNDSLDILNRKDVSQQPPDNSEFAANESRRLPRNADEIRQIHKANQECARVAYEREQEKFPRGDKDRFCKICEENPVTITFVPCGHLVVCESCALGLLMCPMCRKGISKTIRTFFFGN